MILDDLDFNFRGRGLGLGRKYTQPHLLGVGDFEVIDGKPYTLQLKYKTPDTTGRELIYLENNPRLAREAFYKLLQDMPPKSVGVMGFYYFKYDIQALFRDQPQLFKGLATLEDEKHPGEPWEEDGFLWQGCLTWPTVFAIIKHEGRRLLLFDIFRFFEGGLDKVCKDLKVPLSKLPLPDTIKNGVYPRSKEEVEEFEAYAMRDVDAALQIVEIIDERHRAHDMPPKISQAHFWGSVFKKEYTTAGKVGTGKALGLDVPDYLMQAAALKAYHGGRNSLILPEGVEKLPYSIPHVRLYDVSSMYPFCGAYKLPPGWGGRWEWDLSPDREALDPNGFYRVSGQVKAGRVGPYQLLMNHAGDFLEPGKVDKVWFSGVEILTAKTYGLLDVKEITGFHWVEGDLYRKTGKHPFREYFEAQYKIKNENKGVNPVLYEMAKNAMNTVYGKLISTIPHTREDGSIVHSPGSLFNAPMGALFTAHSRCILFEAEVRYGSLHSATDSIMLPGPDFPPEDKGKMGGWELECEGEFVVGRNKLYAIISHEVTEAPGFSGKIPQDNGGKRWYWKGRRILKFALHAFQGTVVDFLECALEGREGYTAQRMGNIREHLRRPDIVPLRFNTIPMKANFKGKYGAKRKEAGATPQ